ncbi:unnamed protein product [Schistocephalus solidus]|uniref:Secreted protein n=1 Tax=Schistocephalus solidus TaxID=70667 RepID=A0A183SC51_SCHSO|nr:unnamed protein product [Schistocephalus solidus]
MRQAAHLFSHTFPTFLAPGSQLHLQKTPMLSHGREIKPTPCIIHKFQPRLFLISLLSFSPTAPPTGHETLQLTCCQLTAHKTFSPCTSRCSIAKQFA